MTLQNLRLHFLRRLSCTFMIRIPNQLKMDDSAPFLPVAAFQSLQAFSERLHLTTLPFHAHEIISAFLIYSTTFLYVSPALSDWLLPSIYPQLARRTRINWNIRVVSLFQSTFISAFALLVILQDTDRRNMDWKARLWGYSSLGGKVQAFAAGYFIWDVVVSAMNIEILGIGSLIHGICALLITMVGFVSHMDRMCLPIGQSNNSSETFCELLRTEFHSLRVINSFSECALVFGQA
jgi:hypothetical protein